MLCWRCRGKVGKRGVGGGPGLRPPGVVSPASLPGGGRSEGTDRAWVWREFGVNVDKSVELWNAVNWPNFGGLVIATQIFCFICLRSTIYWCYLSCNETTKV